MRGSRELNMTDGEHLSKSGHESPKWPFYIIHHRMKYSRGPNLSTTFSEDFPKHGFNQILTTLICSTGSYGTYYPTRMIVHVHMCMEHQFVNARSLLTWENLTVQVLNRAAQLRGSLPVAVSNLVWKVRFQPVIGHVSLFAHGFPATSSWSYSAREWTLFVAFICFRFVLWLPVYQRACLIYISLAFATWNHDANQKRPDPKWSPIPHGKFRSVMGSPAMPVRVVKLPGPRETPTTTWCWWISMYFV